MLGLSSKKDTVKVNKINPSETLEQKCSSLVTIDADINGITAKYNAELNAVREKYQPQIDPLKEQYEERKADIQSYCTTNRIKVFKDSKTLRFGMVELSFRAGTPSVQLAGEQSWEKALEKAEKIAPDCIRTKKELDKTALKKLTEKVLIKLGLTIASEESFSITIKKA